MAAALPKAPTLRALALAGGVGLMVLAGGALFAWLDRNAIGARVAVDYLRRRGVPATIHLTRLDAGGVEGALTLGAPDHPTLIAPHFKAEFARTHLFGAPRLAALQLDGPHLSIAFDGRRLDFGPLQALVDEASRAPHGAGPSPDVSVRNGRLDVATPWGVVHAGANADLAAGRLSRAQLTLQPAKLVFPQGMLDGVTGAVAVRPAPEGRYFVEGELAAAAARADSVSIRQPRVHVSGEAPANLTAGRPQPVRIALSGEALAAVGPERLSAQAARLNATVQGEASGSLANPIFGGHGSARLRADAFAAASGGLAGPDIAIDLAMLDYGGGAIAARGKLDVAAPSGRFGVAGTRGWVRAPRIAVAGSIHVPRSAPVSAELTAAASGVAGLDPDQAVALARRAAPGAAEAQLRDQVARSLRQVTVSAPSLRLSTRGKAWRVALTRPVRALAAGGATVDVAARGGGWTVVGDPRGVRGSGVLSVDGGGLSQARLAVASLDASAGRLRAEIQAALSGSLGPAQGARAALTGRVDARDGAVGLTLARCTALGLDSLQDAEDRPLAAKLSLQVCPLGAAPLATYDGGRWQVAATLLGGSAQAPTAELAFSDVAATLRLAGDPRGPSGNVRLDDLVVADTAKATRFGTLKASGPITIANGRLSGAVAVALARPDTPLGRLTLTADLKRGASEARLQTPQLKFAPNALQPAAILPGLASLGSQVSGPVSAELAAHWASGAAPEASAHIHVDGVQLKTSAGLVTGVRTDLLLSRLDPLTSGPDQRLRADRLAAVVPLTDISADYAVSGDSLALQGAGATLAGGRIALDPMRVPLKAGGALSGVLRVSGVNLGTVIDTLNLSQAVDIQAKMAGTLPFSFGPAGLRISDGRLAAMGPGRLTFKRKALAGAVAAGAGGGATNSTMQDLAYQALENLAFSELDASVASRPKGRLGVVFHVRGRHDPPKAEVARVSLIDLLRGHAFDKPLPLPKGTEVNLTLDTSLNLDDLLGARGGASDPGSGPVHRP